jgi:hypothetical protein
LGTHDSSVIVYRTSGFDDYGKGDQMKTILMIAITALCVGSVSAQHVPVVQQSEQQYVAPGTHPQSAQKAKKPSKKHVRKRHRKHVWSQQSNEKIPGTTENSITTHRPLKSSHSRVASDKALTSPAEQTIEGTPEEEQLRELRESQKEQDLIHNNEEQEMENAYNRYKSGVDSGKSGVAKPK